MGDQSYFCVRLANRIWINFVAEIKLEHVRNMFDTFLIIFVFIAHICVYSGCFEAEALMTVLPLRPGMLVGLEQPAQSWGFKIPAMCKIKALACLSLVYV